MIDGGVFHTYEYISSHYRHLVSVPHAIFGVYYYGQDEKIYQGNKTVKPLSPSPYCWPAPIRRLPEPVGSTTALKNSITVEIPENGHKIADLEYKESTVRNRGRPGDITKLCFVEELLASISPAIIIEKACAELCDFCRTDLLTKYPLYWILYFYIYFFLALSLSTGEWDWWKGCGQTTTFPHCPNPIHQLYRSTPCMESHI